MIHWAVPWTADQIINGVLLGIATVIVISVPATYGAKANLRDPLARAVLSGTAATALAFTLALVSLIAFHCGWTPPVAINNWLARMIYTVVALGKLSFFLGLRGVLREQKEMDAMRERFPETGFPETGFPEAQRDGS